MHWQSIIASPYPSREVEAGNIIEKRISAQAVAEYACAEPGAVLTGGTEGERRGGRTALRGLLHRSWDTSKPRWTGGADLWDGVSLFRLEVGKKLQQREVVPPPRL